MLYNRDSLAKGITIFEDLPGSNLLTCIFYSLNRAYFKGCQHWGLFKKVSFSICHGPHYLLYNKGIFCLFHFELHISILKVEYINKTLIYQLARDVLYPPKYQIIILFSVFKVINDKLFIWENEGSLEGKKKVSANWKPARFLLIYFKDFKVWEKQINKV